MPIMKGLRPTGLISHLLFFHQGMTQQNCQPSILVLPTSTTLNQEIPVHYRLSIAGAVVAAENRTNESLKYLTWHRQIIFKYWTIILKLFQL